MEGSKIPEFRSNPRPGQPIPSSTLQRVGWPTPRPFDIKVDMTDPDTFDTETVTPHPWEVTDGGTVDDVRTWNVRGGMVYDHIVSPALAIEVPDTPIGTESGVIYLRIERDSASREVVDALIDFAAEDVPADDYVYQHFPLATVGGEGDDIVQVRFEDIRVFEMLIVSNGEFRYGNFQMMGLMNYELPE